MDRRRFLAGISTGSVLSLSGCADQVSKAASGVASTPEKGQKVGEKTYSSRMGTYLKKIEFYKNGFVDVTLSEDHDMSRIGILHEARDFGPKTEPLKDAYKIWGLPEFSGPETYNIKKPIMGNNDSYPTNIFKFKVAPEEDMAVFSATQDVFQFPVPESFVPEGTTIQQEL
jgi:hypothetical protein